MATTIVTKYSAVADSEPTTSNIVAGEIASNVTDGLLFTRNDSNAIITYGIIRAGAADNNTARFDNSAGHWVANTNFTVTAAGALTGTSFAGTVDGVVGSGTPAAATFTSAVVNSTSLVGGTLKVSGHNTGFGLTNIAIMHGASTAGYVSALSTTTIGLTNTSDRRLKEDIQDYDTSEAMEALSSVSVRNFRWKESQERQVGFIADELQDALPYIEIVQGDRDGERMQTINTAGLIPMLWAQNKELLARIEALEAS